MSFCLICIFVHPQCLVRSLDLTPAWEVDAVRTTLLARCVLSSRRASRDGNMDMEYSYAVAPYRVESDTQVDEDYARIHAPSVTSTVEREEEERESDGDEQDPPAPDVFSASTPSTSVGGSPSGATSPRRAPEAQEPPQRRRRLEPTSALFPATPESVSEVPSSSAQANDNLAGADADSSADASHSASH
ncbi:hypothetical protein Emag_000016 [Eimeria magna]